MKEIKINAGKVICCSLFLLYLTNVMFLFGWLNFMLSIPACAVISAGYVYAVKIIAEKCAWQITFSYSGFFLLCISILVVVWVCGIGGFFAQGYDYFVRNPIYRDLVLNEWPVIYTDTNRALCYYFGYWLLPALFSKIFFFWCSEYVIWQGAQIVLFLYTALNLFLVFLLICIALSKWGQHTFSLKEMLKIIFVFCAWGGVSVGGYFMFQMAGIPASVIRTPIAELSLKELWQTGTLLEHYAREIAIVNGNIIQLSHVFNQTIPAWIATAVFLIMKDEVSVYAYTGFLILISAPFPVIGLGFMMLSVFCRKVIDKQVKIKDVFSIPNMCSLPVVIAGILFYRKSVESNLQPVVKHFFKDNTLPVITAGVLIVAFFAFGIYTILTDPQIKNFLFYASQIVFVGCYFVGIGSEGDLAMRAVIPMFFYFMILIMQTMFFSKGNKWRKCLLAGVVGISGLIQFHFIAVMGKMCLDYGTFRVQNDYLYTFSNNYGTDDNGYLDQYTKLNPSQDLFFGKMCRGSCDISKPVIEYAAKTNEEGKKSAYIKKVSIKREYVDAFLKSVVCADDAVLKEKLLEKCAVNDQPVVIYFEEDELLPRMESDLVFSEEDFSLNWTNYNRSYPMNHMDIPASIELEYTGTEPVQIWQEINPQRESGVLCALYDSDGSLIYDPWAYSFTKHVIFSGQKEQYIFGIPKPEQTGEYKLVFYFFYNQNQVYARYSKKEYLVEIN